MYEEFETQYNRINWRKGRYATPVARKSIRDFWVSQGQTGAEWLVKQLDSETHLELLEGVSGLLVHIGSESIKPIVQALKGSLRQDKIEVLLKTLGGIEAPYEESLEDLENLIAVYLSNPDSDIREAACTATAILPKDRAIKMLQHQRSIESEQSVIDALDDAIQDRDDTL